MKVNLKSVSQILDSKISIEQRGLLITALLCKDVNPKITLAKFKVYTDLKRYKLDMIFLHENKLLSWSGYKLAKKSVLKDLNSKDVNNIIDFMNTLYKRNFNANTYTEIVNKRLSEHTIEEIKLVIANRYEEWKDDSVMEKHLNPTTIFRKSKFDKYFEEANRTRIGSGIVSVKAIDLKNGDVLNVGNTNDFVDGDLYKVKRHLYNNGFSKNGVSQTFLGKELKKTIKIQNNIEISGGDKEFLFTFVEK